MENRRLNAPLSDFISPTEPLLISEWADKYRILSSEASAEPGSWRSERALFQKGIMDAVTLPETREVIIQSSSQVGKSEILLNTLAYYLAHEPCPILFVQPTREMAESFSKDRIAPMLRDCPIFADIVFPTKGRSTGNTLLHKQFKNGSHFTLSGANSAASLSSRPIRVVLADEIDRYPLSAGTEGDPVALATKRTTTFWNSKIILASTPSLVGFSRIEKAYNTSDKRKYKFPCPHCKQLIDFSWENIKYSGKETSDFSFKDIYYECPICLKIILESIKNKLIGQGQWVAEKAFNGRVGFYVNELYSPWRSWQQVAASFEIARHDFNQYKVWINTSLGLPMPEERVTSFDWEILYEKAQSSSYSQGEIPEDCLLLTAGVDVQKNRLEVSTFGWGNHEQWWLISHHQILGDCTDDATWEALEQFLNIPYRHPLGKTIAVAKAMVDSGYNTQEIYYQASFPTRKNWNVIKGKAGAVRALLSLPSFQEINYKGKKITKGVRLFTVGTDEAKTILLSRALNLQKGLHLPNDVPIDWVQGFAASEVKKKVKKNGQETYIWEHNGVIPNEPLDCSVYAYCAAMLYGLKRINWEVFRLRLSGEAKSAIISQPSYIINSESQDIFLGNNKSKVPSVARRKSANNWTNRI